MTWFKPTGWDILELRYGGQITRITSLHDRLKQSLRRFESLYIPSLRAGQGFPSVMSVDDTGHPATTMITPAAMSLDSIAMMDFATPNAAADPLDNIEEAIGNLNWRDPATKGNAGKTIGGGLGSSTRRPMQPFIFLEEWEETSGEDDWPIVLTDENTWLHAVIEYSRSATHQRLLGSR
jgi:hypothetical protein